MGVVVDRIKALYSPCKCFRIKKKDGTYEDLCYKEGVVGALSQSQERALCREKIISYIDGKYDYTDWHDRDYKESRANENLKFIGMDRELYCKSNVEEIECYFDGKTHRAKEVSIFSTSEDIIDFGDGRFRIFGVDSFVKCAGDGENNRHRTMVCLTEKVVPEI